MKKLNEITTKEIKYINDPKNLSALEKIHEMSNKAKQRKPRKSPTNINHFKVEDNVEINNNTKGSNFSRRRSHFATMKYPEVNELNHKFGIQKYENLRNNNVDNNPKEYVWDKKNNRLMEKNILSKIEENEEDTKEKIANTQKEIKKVNIKDKKTEKGEILKKLKDYKKAKERDSGKKTEIIYEKQVVQEGDEEFDDNNYNDKNIVNSKNTKIYKKIIKDESGSKVIIKKIVEEISEKDNGDKLVFDEDSDDDEDLEKELKDIEMGKSDKNDMKYEIIKEKFDAKGNKIYSKEILTNKKPKEM